MLNITLIVSKVLITQSSVERITLARRKKNTQMKNYYKLVVIVLMIVMAGFCRLLTNYLAYHTSLPLFNFTPIAAMGLFAGANLRDKKLAFALPIITLFFTDLALGLHSGVFAVYGSIALITGIGIWLEKKQNIIRIIGASLASSVIFFTITIGFVWFQNPTYTQNFSGLLACYTAGIPFFGNTVAGDLFFCAVLFGGYSFLKYRTGALIAAKNN